MKMKQVQNVLGLLSAVFVAASCSKPAPAPPMPVQTPMPTRVETPVPAVGVQLKSLVLGSAIGADNRVTQATTTFNPGETIYVSVLTEGSAASATISARFVYGPDAQLVNESSQTIASAGPAATEFHISKADGWPVGAYAVLVSLNGGDPMRADFNVQ